MGTIELSLLADHPQLSATLARWYHEEWGAHLPGAGVDQFRAKIDRAVNRDTMPLIVLARQGGRLVGAAELKYRENEHFPEYEHWMGGVIVDPQCRGLGVSSLLVEAVKRHASRLGVERLYLQCEHSLAGLYEKRDFVILHAATHRGLPVVIMAWPSGVDAGSAKLAG